MKNMKTKLVSIETTRLAMAKGFPNSILTAHKLTFKKARNLYEWLHGTYLTSQNTLQKWLRETHNIEFVLKPFHDSNTGKTTYVADPIHLPSGKTARIARQDTYEKALELGLQEALKLIPDENKSTES